MKLLNELFEDNMETPVAGTKAKRAKGSTFQTVSALYRVCCNSYKFFKVDKKRAHPYRKYFGWAFW